MASPLSSNNPPAGLVLLSTVPIDPSIKSSRPTTNNETANGQTSLSGSAPADTQQAKQIEQGRNDDDIFSITSEMFKRFSESFNNWGGAVDTTTASLHDEEEREDVTIMKKEEKKTSPDQATQLASVQKKLDTATRVKSKDNGRGRSDQTVKSTRSKSRRRSDQTVLGKSSSRARGSIEPSAGKSTSRSRQLVSFVAGDDESIAVSKHTKSRSSKKLMPRFKSKKDKTVLPETIDENMDADLKRDLLKAVKEATIFKKDLKKAAEDGVDDKLKSDLQQTLKDVKKSAKKSGVPVDWKNIKGTVDEVFYDPDFVQDVKEELFDLVGGFAGVLKGTFDGSDSGSDEDDYAPRRK